MNSQSPHILVTGGAGFIGSHLVERLLTEGKSVTVIDDCSTGRLENLRAIEKNPKFTFIQSRVSQCPDLAAVAGRSSFIYHLASSVGVDLVLDSCIRTIDNTFHETEVLLNAAVKNKTPVLIASTSEVYGKSSKAVFSEEDDLLIGPPHLSRWSYACSKLMDEFLALAYGHERGLPVIVTRLFNTVGPRQTGRYGMVLPRFIQAARNGEPLKAFGDGHQTRCFCFVEDTVEALIRLAECSKAYGEVFNVGSSEEVSITNLAQKVIELSKSKSHIEYIPYEKAYGQGFQDMLRRKPNVEKLVRFTGFRPATSLHRIIELTLNSPV